MDFAGESAIRQRLGDVVFKTTFQGPDATHYFLTNKLRIEHNAQIMSRMAPVVRIDSTVSDAAARSRRGAPDQAGVIPNTMYLVYEGRFMWLQNEKPLELGLVNGSQGIVKDYIYAHGDAAPKLPIAIIVELPSYTGPPFFTGEEKCQWVPLRPKEVSWSLKKSSKSVKGFPMTASFALTAHKAQGQTNKAFAAAHVGDKESVDNGTYIMCSRSTRLAQLCIAGGASFERLNSSGLATKGLKTRLAEEVRLTALAESTKAAFALFEARNGL
jgi:hypothetical protein